MKKKVLFLCIHNSARSQMAEAYLNHFGSEHFEAESAGLEAGHLNPLVVTAMKEEGLDLSNNTTNSVFDFFKEGRIYQYVITVCDQANAERCPIFPGVYERINWSFPDPSVLQGTDEEKLAQIRFIRDRIKEAVMGFVAAN
jgi:arsenate reductase